MVYDRTGQLLNEIGDPNFGRRTAVELNQISPYVADATIATEDPNFYSHPGVDPVGLARAVYYAIRQRDLSGPGGSTITQQLVKLTYLSAEKTISRKVKEAILAAEITRATTRTPSCASTSMRSLMATWPTASRRARKPTSPDTRLT